ncbi:MAG TPA: hypothetical protein VMT03_17770 [Polyangia bacterium]|nr:hypothetical protein [Polyangia bacterium]
MTALVALRGLKIWLATSNPDGSRVLKLLHQRDAARLVDALAGELEAGRAAHLLLESQTCGPVRVTLLELVELGVLQSEPVPVDEHAVVVARRAIDARTRRGLR